MKKNSYFEFKPFSRKQKKVLTWWMPDSPVSDRDGIIADGAIRSGKTLSMSLSYVIWAMETFDGNVFGMAGKTISSFRRNVLFWLKLMLLSRGYHVEDKRSENMIIVSNGLVTNYFYIFGGKDESSQDLIQGVTLSGMFFDEVALMPESFVNQATGRCSVEGSKLWFNCNPDSPKHFFKLDWIDKAEEKNILYLHFNMRDNLSLSERMIQRYENMYSGTFFKRFILGLWVRAEGLIYGNFADNKHEYMVNDVDISKIMEICIGVDFGGNKSNHAFVASAITKDYKVMALKAKSHPASGVSVEKLTELLEEFIKDVQKYGHIRHIAADSAEQTIINSLRAKLKIPVKNSIKNKILDRIRCEDILISTHSLSIVEGQCDDLIEGLENALWNPKEENERLDDGTTDIDILDAFEYSWEHRIKSLIRR